MSKRVTLTNRWREWWKVEPFWAYLALATMMLSFLSLGMHLLFFLPGLYRTIGLWAMGAFAGITEVLFIIRRQLWWSLFWGICVILGVIVFEILSYFVGKPIA